MSPEAGRQPWLCPDSARSLIFLEAGVESGFRKFPYRADCPSPRLSLLFKEFKKQANLC